MKITTINNIYTDENTYIVFDENEKIGVVIDPGNPTEIILSEANKENLKIKYIIITHCHYDHIEYLEDLRDKTGAQLISSEKASFNIQNPSISLTIRGLEKNIVCRPSDIIMEDGEIMNIGNIKVKCIYTPGHTDCGASFLFNDTDIFVGDTLFLRNCGRWDLPTGNEKILIGSVKNKLYTLNEDITIYPGHGQKTSIGYEKKYNIYIK